MRIIILLLLLLTPNIYTVDLQFENIDVDQINKLLPEKWYISEISTVSTPTGWTKSSGDIGICITISRIPYSFDLGKTKSGNLEIWHPEFIFFIMPNNFSGESDNGVLFKGGKIDTPENMAGRAMLILNNIKQLGDYYIFYIDVYFKDWKKPEELFDKILIKNKKP